MGDLLDAIEGVDPTARVEWDYVLDGSLDEREAAVEARPASVFFTVHGPVEEGEW